MIKKVFIVIFLVKFITTAAQVQLRDELGTIYYTPDLYKTKYNMPEGSPYLNEKFTSAKINDIRETKLVRFDAVEGNVEVMITGTKVVVLDNSRSYIISMLDGSKKVYETLKYTDERGNGNTSFFELLDSTIHYKIYLKEKKKFFKKVKAQGYADAEPAQFKKVKDEFYISDFRSKTNRLLAISQKMKSFIEFFPDDSRSIKKYVKENRLKTDNGEDLIKIFRFYYENKN